MAKEILIEIILKDRQASAKLKETTKATDDLKKSTDNLTASEKKLKAAEEKLAFERSDDAAQLAEINEQIKIQRDLNTSLAKSQLGLPPASSRFTKSIDKNTKALTRNRATAGLNTAIIQELGRTASDASFGITAITNNVSQLLFLFQSSIEATGSFRNAFKSFTRSLLGGGGFLVAIQLVISYLPQIINFFKESVLNVDLETEALKKNTEEILNNQAARQKLLDTELKQVRESFKIFKSIFENNIDNVEKQDLLLIELSERLSKLSVDRASLLKDETIDIGARIQIAENLLLIEGERVKIEENRAKEAVESNELEKRRATLQQTRNSDLEVGEKIRKKAINTATSLVIVQEDKIKALTNSSIKSQGKIKELTQEIDRLAKRGVVVTPQDLKESEDNLEQAKINTLDFSKEIIRANNSILKQGSSDRFAAIKFAGKQELELLEARKDRFIQKEKERFEAGSITEEQFNQTRLQAEEEYGKAAIAVKKANNAKLTKAEEDFYRAIAELSAQNNRNQQSIDLELDLVSENIEGKRVKRRLDLQQTQLDSQIKFNKNLLKDESLTEDKRQELISKTIRLEQQKTDIVRQLADARAQAEVQSLEVVGNALTAFSSLAGKNSAAGKALAVSGALISTYLSAQKAFESQFSPIALVDSPVRGTIAAAAAVASGLANVKSILAVDSGGQSSVGGAQSNITATAPQFNVVGASQANQLATAIGPIASQETKVNLVYEDFKGVEDNVTKTNVAAGLG